MIKEIYHGSDEIIKKPIFGYGKKYNDEGMIQGDERLR